jgi:hypothetical protein
MTSRTIWIFLILLLNGCYYGVNEMTSEIGSLNSTCLEDSVWKELTAKYTVDSISKPEFREGLKDVKNHFIKPQYILYFSSGPEEIIGCDWYTVRVVFNPNLSTRTMSGLDPSLSDDEQVRIRNRVQKLLIPYQCDKGKLESLEWMKQPAVFSEE